MATRGTANIGTRSALVAGTALAVLVTVAPVSTAGAAPPPAVRTCPVPTAAANPTWSTVAGIPPGETAVEIEGIPAPPLATIALDMDGDGTTDTTSGPNGGPVVVHRGDGDLTVTGIPEDGVDSGFVFATDLNGDGHTELGVQRTTGLGSGRRLTTWIIPGTTPVGTVAATDVGLSFEGTVVGDVTGDGHDDLALRLSLLSTPLPLGWVSGAEVLAALPSATPFTGLEIVALRADLDFDGDADRVYRSTANGTTVELSTGTNLTLSSTNPYGVYAYRSGSKTILQTLAISTSLLVQGFDIHTACADAWMRSAVPQLMGRNPTAADYVGFGPTSEPTEAERVARTEAMVRSQSARNVQITTTYDFYLGRAADPVGRAYWLKGLRNGTQNLDAMTATLLGSREFLVKRTGGDPQSWVQAVFPKAMGRTADPAGLAYWTQQASKYGPQRAAARLLASPESRRYRIRALHDSIYVLSGPQPAGVIALDLANYNAFGFEYMYAKRMASDAVYLKAQRTNRMHR